jgi:tRNA A37 methylthiotransferase MiaB
LNVIANIKDIHQHTDKQVKVIIGGPSVGILRDDNYLANLPEVEFAIYSQGERPFVDIIKHYLGIEKISVLKTKNVAWLENNKLKKADYEFIKVKTGSPVISSEHLLERISHDPSLAEYDKYWPYETSRGCPYSCTFCDWTSGLSNKTSKRVADYETELDLLGKYNFTNIYIADANFGLFKEDVGIAETMVRLKRERGYNWIIHGTNFSKTKKDVVFKIAEIWLEGGLLMFARFSLQDIHEEVLENIDRPDLSWDKHLQYILEIQRKFPDTFIALDLIKGLPGQTRETWENIFNEMCQYNFQLEVYDWEMIANSPASYDKEYQANMKIKTLMVTVDNFERENIVETLSYDRKDYAYFTILFDMYYKYFRNYVPAFPRFMQLIKASDKLDFYIDRVVENLQSKSAIKSVLRDFLIDILKENAKVFTPTFIKYLHSNINGAADHTLVIKPTEVIMQEVYKE